MKYFKNVEIFEKVLLIRGPLGDVYENWSRFKWLLNGRTNYLNDIRLSRKFYFSKLPLIDHYETEF